MSPFGAYVDVDSGLRCMVSSWRRVDDNAAPARAKCTGIYINSALAKTEAMENGFDDAVPFGRLFVAAAPDRMIWGTDWPHVNWRKSRMMNDAETVELLYRYVDNDQALLQKILVGNPARLHGFD